MTDPLIAELKDAGIITGTNREKTTNQWWLSGGSRLFLSIRDDKVTLWEDRRPFINQKIDEMPLEQADAVSVAALVY